MSFNLIEPFTTVPGIVSFIRFRQRKKVDLPHPDGPIKAVTWFGKTSMQILLSAWDLP
jgi:hypothetical protein